MSIFASRSVDDQPALALVRWRIFETLDRHERHLVGHCPEAGPGRVSSALSTLDLTTGVGLSSSGRRYQLLGPPGYDDDAQYIWEVWAEANGVPGYRDITLELLADVARAQSKLS